MGAVPPTLWRIANVPSILVIYLGNGGPRTNPRIDECSASSEDTRKRPSKRARVRLQAYADQVLGRTRFHADPTTREHALRRQYLLRRSALRRPHLHLRLRHRIPRARPAIAKRIWRPPIFRPRLRLALSLGLYSGD